MNKLDDQKNKKQKRKIEKNTIEKKQIFDFFFFNITKVERTIPEH